MQEMRVWSLIQEDPLEEGMATHSSILVWGIQWTEEPVGLQSMGSQRVEHNLATKQQWGQNGKGLLKGLCWEFPGWPVVKTPGFHSRGQGLNPDWETKIPHATWHGQKKKRKKKPISSVYFAQGIVLNILHLHIHEVGEIGTKSWIENRGSTFKVCKEIGCQRLVYSIKILLGRCSKVISPNKNKSKCLN